MASNPWIVPAILVAVAVAAASVGGAYLYYHERPVTSSGSTRVALGTNVTVNYIGIFGSGPEQGRVFDTSIYAVAENNAQFPKSLQYHARGPEKNYTTLDVYVGSGTPSGGYTFGNLTFIQVVTGFWQGIVGMVPNTTRTITVPQELGYGPVNTGCVATKSLVQTVPVLETLSGINFQKSYPGLTAANGVEFTDPHFGWTDMILSANSSYVTLERLPYVGESSSTAGWPVVVTSIQSTANGSGEITVRNELTPADAGHLLGHDFLGTGPCSSQSGGKFIITNVDVSAGTFTENFNSEVQGQTLIFLVTVVDYFP
jgi:FKBP-type peptidyl-prolyl cis-trans isomerase 2